MDLIKESIKTALKENSAELINESIEAALKDDAQADLVDIDTPTFEPEDCEMCSDESPDYEQDFKWENGTWVCQGCGTPQ